MVAEGEGVCGVRVMARDVFEDLTKCNVRLRDSVHWGSWVRG